MRDLEKLADEIASKIDRTVSDAERKIKKKWKGNWEARVHSAGSDFQSATDSFKRVPDRLSDPRHRWELCHALSLRLWFNRNGRTDGFCGLMLVLISLAENPPWINGATPSMLEKLSGGLCLIVSRSLFGGQVAGSKDRETKSTRQKSASHTPSRPGKRGQPYRDRSRYGHQNNG